MDYYEDLQSQYQKTLEKTLIEKDETISKLKGKLKAATVLLKKTETENLEKLATAKSLLKSQSSLIEIYSRYENTHNEVNCLEIECLQLKTSFEILTSQFEKQQNENKNILTELGGAVGELHKQATKLKKLNSVNCLLSSQVKEEVKYYQNDMSTDDEQIQSLDKHETNYYAFTDKNQIETLEDQIYEKIFTKHDKANKEALNTIQKLTIAENQNENVASRYRRFTKLQNDLEIEHKSETFTQSNLKLITISSTTSSQAVLEIYDEPNISINSNLSGQMDGIVPIEPKEPIPNEQTLGTSFQFQAKDLIPECNGIADKDISPTACPDPDVGMKKTVEAGFPTKSYLHDGPMTTFARNSSTISAPKRKQHSIVMMVHGLDTLNADKLFNLVSLYGNVAKIKFLKTMNFNNRSAMVEMGDELAVYLCVKHLNRVPLGGNGKLEITYSRQQFLHSEKHPFMLADNTESFKDYTASNMNRFSSPKELHKNQIRSPSKILYFFDTPPDLKEDILLDVLKSKEVVPESIHMSSLKGDTSSGLIEFKNVADAVMAVINCNNVPVEGKSQQLPFNLQLNFAHIKNMGYVNRQTKKKTVMYHYYQH